LAEGRIDMGTRKPNQRSSIYYSESDGYWHGWVVVGTKEDGLPDRRHRSAMTEAEVTRRVQDLEGKRSDGHLEKPGRPLTVAALPSWSTHRSAKNPTSSR
jgi:hypothetical protein